MFEVDRDWREHGISHLRSLGPLTWLTSARCGWLRIGGGEDRFGPGLHWCLDSNTQADIEARRVFPGIYTSPRSYRRLILRTPWGQLAIMSGDRAVVLTEDQARDLVAREQEFVI